MQKKNILISVIDGQGGGIGRQYISSLTSVLPKDLPVTIRALGTNSLATSNKAVPTTEQQVRMPLSSMQNAQI